MSVELIAARLLAAYAGGALVDPAPGSAPTLAEAYRIQDLVVRGLGGARRVHAWKVIPPEPGAEPRAAPIPPGKVLDSPAQLPVAGLRMIGVEAEIAFRFAQDLPPRDTPYADSEVAAAVGEALVAIEICDSRLAGWKTAPSLWKLADLQSNAALVAGSGRRDWQGIDFSVQRVELRIDGALGTEAVGSHACVNPFLIVPWIANHCAARCGGLRAGDLVTAGSWTGITFVQPGAEARARFPGIGEVSVAVVP